MNNYDTAYEVPVDKVPIMKITNLNFSYNNFEIIKNAEFSISSGDFICITGPNGSGKTTLLKLLLGILKPDSGTITKTCEVHISYVSQNSTSFNAQFPATVKEIVELGLYNRGKIFRSKRERVSDSLKVRKALDNVGLSRYGNRMIGKLSGGQKQRFFIAKALVSEPDCVFLDEPTSGVDVTSTDQICCLLGELNKRYGLTVLMITHDIESIITHATKVLNIKSDGSIEILSAHEYLNKK